MKHLFQIIAPLFLSVSALVAFTAGVAPAETKAKKHWVCPACGLPCDNQVFDEPGVCPGCGMPLVEQGSEGAHHHSAPTKVGILVFNGVEIIDFAGPYEVFGAANFDVYTVGETKDPVVSAMGLKIVPRYSFTEAPQPDILVVPGGGVQATQSNTTVLKWLTDRAAQAQHTMSVCNGAFILASAGLLDGLGATTTARHIERLQAQYPKIKVVNDQRFVDNGKIMTTAGLSAGIDGALHLVKKMRGEGYAQLVALGIEYDWRGHAGFARAALADRLLPDLDVDDRDKWEILKFQGGTDRWELVVRPVSANPDNGVVMDHFTRALAKGKWTNVNSTATRTEWKFNGRDGKPWMGTVTLEPALDASAKYDVKVTIARAG
jgi:putative intracellular protease/amidase